MIYSMILSICFSGSIGTVLVVFVGGYFSANIIFKDKEKQYSKYRVIMNQICTFGGDTDTNACIVGTVIGPLCGFRKFGDVELVLMMGIPSRDRCINNPCLMILFVDFLMKSTELHRGGDLYYFFYLMMDFLFGEIDYDYYTKLMGGKSNELKEEIKKSCIPLQNNFAPQPSKKKSVDEKMIKISDFQKR